jgi:hypothetical protein
MANRLRRSILSIFGICSIAWAVNSVFVFPGRAWLAETALRVLSGERFSPAQLNAMKVSLDTTSARTLQASDLSNVAVIRLLLSDDRIRFGKRPYVSDLAELQRAVSAAIDQSPSNSFMWLTDLWVKLQKGDFVERDWNLLRMSYETGPNEAWIAVRRNTLALGVFQSLPSGLAEQALSEFVGLVRSGLYVEAANILAGLDRVIREKLLARLVDLKVASRHAFASVLKSRNLDEADILERDHQGLR